MPGRKGPLGQGQAALGRTLRQEGAAHSDLRKCRLREEAAWGRA